jgi:hypothetical protein
LTLSLDTPVEQIAADPGGKAVLNRDVPGLLANPSYFLFENMNLSQLAAVSGGRANPARGPRLGTRTCNHQLDRIVSRQPAKKMTQNIFELTSGNSKLFIPYIIVLPLRRSDCAVSEHVKALWLSASIVWRAASH